MEFIRRRSLKFSNFKGPQMAFCKNRQFAWSNGHFWEAKKEEKNEAAVSFPRMIHEYISFFYNLIFQGPKASPPMSPRKKEFFPFESWSYFREIKSQSHLLFLLKSTFDEKFHSKLCFCHSIIRVM